MLLERQVSEIMTTPVIQVQVDTHLRDVLLTMKKGKFRHLPVVKGNQLVGIVSKTDINRLSFSGLIDDQDEADDAMLEMLQLSQVMNAEIRVVKDTDTLEVVANIFAQEEFHALPVVDHNNQWQCVGIITTTDIIKMLLESRE